MIRAGDDLETLVKAASSEPMTGVIGAGAVLDGYAVDSGYPHVKRIRAGFPFLCFEDWWYPWKGAMYAEIVSGSIEPEPGRIPVTPVPGALLANAAIYGLASWGLVAVVTLARAALRSRRGLCRRCGYALAGTATCSECGTPASGGGAPRALTP